MLRRAGMLDRTRQNRDAALHYVATEDTVCPAPYFEELERIGASDPSRVKVIPIPTPPEGGRSSPADVVARLREFLGNLDRVQPFDGRWVLIDVDHHFTGSHQRNLATALQQAASIGAEVLVSNPCFEVWLLMHVADLTGQLPGAPDVHAALQAARPGWRKDEIKRLQLDRDCVGRAVRAGRQGAVDGVVPRNPGSMVWRLVERLDSAR